VTDAPAPAYGIESVDRAMRVLLLLRTEPVLRVADVSKHLGVAPSTAHRLLATLCYRGFVLADPATHTYRVGPALGRWGATGDGELIAVARPHIAALAEHLRETVNLLVLEGTNCRFVHGIGSDRPLRTSVRAGALMPAHAVSGGKVLLAELPAAHVERLFARHPPQRLTAHTIVDTDALRAELHAVRERGYAVNVGESEDGITAVAAPVRDPRGVAVGAIAVSAPSSRTDDAAVTTILDALRRTTAELEAELGAEPDPA
jgi:DNA-binding IclR family transcriptional regulator